MNLLIAFLTVISICIYYILTFRCVGQYFLEGLVLFIPIIILLRLKFLMKNKEIKENIAICFSILIMILYFIGVHFGMIFLIVEDGTTTVTNVHEYRRILNLESEKLTYYFPRKVPKTAKDVQYYYCPQFLQGGMEMKLEFKASKEEIESYIDKYKEDYIEIINVSEHPKDELNDFGIYSYGINLNETREDVTIYLIMSEPGNHGILSFMAVNDEHTEILFQAERW